MDSALNAWININSMSLIGNGCLIRTVWLFIIVWKKCYGVGHSDNIRQLQHTRCSDYLQDGSESEKRKSPDNCVWRTKVETITVSASEGRPHRWDVTGLGFHPSYFLEPSFTLSPNGRTLMGDCIQRYGETQSQNKSVRKRLCWEKTKWNMFFTYKA